MMHTYSSFSQQSFLTLVLEWCSYTAPTSGLGGRSLCNWKGLWLALCTRPLPCQLIGTVRSQNTALPLIDGYRYQGFFFLTTECYSQLATSRYLLFFISPVQSQEEKWGASGFTEVPKMWRVVSCNCHRDDDMHYVINEHHRNM